MKDILKKYRKNKIISNINIILASLVLAFWINFVLIDWTNIGQSLKTSVLNSEVQNIKSDLSVEYINNELYIIANKNINEATSLSFSLTYNPENIVIKNISSEFWDVLNLWNTPWINSIIITSDSIIDIQKWNKIAIINLIKEKKNKTENLNIINANFKDINLGHYTLTTSWITF